jgi:hypothetical protein
VLAPSAAAEHDDVEVGSHSRDSWEPYPPR